MKKVLSIAGSDCSGGAGIQADLKTFSAHGVFGMSVIVSVVAENTSRVIDIQDITPDMIEKQIDAVFEDIEVDAVKIGMLSTPECMKAVAKKLLQSNLQRHMSQWQSNTLLRLGKAVARRTISTNCISMVYLKNRQVQNEL